MNNTLENQKSIKLILHPGHGKCGSSSIQSFLRSNINNLQKLDIHMPNQDFRFSFEQQKLSTKLNTPLWYFKNLLDHNDIDSFERRLKEVLKQATESNCKGIIISAENLSNVRGITKGRRIHEILASHFDEKIVIFYVRRQDDYLVSSWQQWAHKKGESLQEYIDNSLNRHTPDFLKIAEFFEEVYGEDSLTVVPLHRKALKEGNLIADFCYRSQLKLPEDNNTEIQANQSLNTYLCDILRRIPNIYEDHNDQSVKRLLANYVDTKKILLASDKKILSQDQRNRILKEFEHDNHILNTKYFDYLPYDEFISQKTYSEMESSNNENYEMEQLKNIIAIQMEILIKLLKEKEQQKVKNQQTKQMNLKKIIKQIRKAFFK